MAVEITLQAQIQSLRTAIEGRLAADEPAPRAELPWQAGERVTATVEALRQGERALLRIGAFVFDVKLPAGAEVGQRLNLTFVSASPRITFALSDEPQTPPTPPAARQGVEISPAARNLNALVQSVAPERPAARPSAVRDPLPLLPAPARDAAPLAAALQRSVETSGLFYESHLAQWAAGERPLALVKQEPQGRIPARAAPVPPPAALPATGAVEEAADALAPDTPSLARGVSAPPPLLEPIDQRLMAQVRSQIESLDARQIIWQGQAWPGLPMEWRVDEPPEESQSADGALAWASHLKLTFPVLGEVVADLVLAGNALGVRLYTTQADTRVALGEGQGLLRDALERASIRLMHFTIDE